MDGQGRRGIKVIHVFGFEARDGDTLAPFEESWEG
jgi:hypothetical protein